jgi:hypothetical protein
MTNAAKQWIEQLVMWQLAGELRRAQPRRRELNRWALREEGKLPAHRDKLMRSKRQRQLKAIEAKKAAARALSRQGRSSPSKAAIRREIARAPHVYL